MNDEVYLKTETGGLWEKNTRLAFAIYTFIGIIIFFTFLLAIPLFIPTIPITLWSVVIFILFLIILVYLTVKLNQRHNMSKSTAFIKRDGKLYAIQLLYTKEKLGTETSRNMIYMPSGTALQSTTLDNNFKVATDVLAYEKDIRERREKAESFVIALDDILEHLSNKPEEYHLLSDNKRTKLDNLFRYHVENNGLAYIETKNSTYNFLILDNPEIMNRNKNNFTIAFHNEKNEKCTAKFTNCYGNIMEEIDKMNS
ncbi:MAG: hypothetical protein HDT41_05750 [Lachnospiraceae bacterium]|nr:hypothetical protein [Lachnospiraceae bacterium]